MRPDSREETPLPGSSELGRDGQLSLLYELVRLFSDSAEGDRALARALPLIVEALRMDVAEVHVLEEGRLVLRGHHQRFGPTPDVGPLTTRVLPLDAESVSGRAVLTRRTVNVTLADWPAGTKDTAEKLGLEAGVATPLLANDRVLGSLSMFRRSKKAVTPAELELFEVCAAQSALTLDHARLLDAQRGQVKDLRLILEVGQAITRTQRLEEILERAAPNLARLVDASDSFLWLIEPKTGDLRGVFTSASEHQAHFSQVRLPLDAPSLAAVAAKTMRPVQTEDGLGSDVVNASLIVRYGMRGMLALPLLLGDEAVGVAVVGDARRPRVFSAAEVERGMVMAAQLAVAVSNARLFADLKSSYDALARTQQELVRRERLAALGELAAVVAHEVRNPLGVIYNSIASLRRILQPQGEAEVLFNFVHEEAERLDAIVGDLLDFARPREAELRPHSLAALVNLAVKSMESAFAAGKVRVTVEVPESLPAVLADERLMRQALVNLLLNAIQAMPRGGNLLLRGFSEVGQGVRWVRLDVADTGPGIPEELREKVFQPFYTTKATGSGLGLAVVRRILDAHQGEVFVARADSTGTVIALRLSEASA